MENNQNIQNNQNNFTETISGILDTEIKSFKEFCKENDVKRFRTAEFHEGATGKAYSVLFFVKSNGQELSFQQTKDGKPQGFNVTLSTRLTNEGYTLDQEFLRNHCQNLAIRETTSQGGRVGYKLCMDNSFTLDELFED